MDSLSMVEARLPPGFRFHPRDDELVLDYLSRKLDGDGGGAVSVYGCPMMVEVDLNKCEPWDLPEIACVGGKEWYFYSLKDKKYATGQRTNRATESGHWKATGKDRLIRQKGLLVGMRKTLVFYQGRAPKGRKTEWVMHEFRKEEQEAPVRFPFKEDWVLCRVFYKSRATTTKPTGESACYKGTTSTSIPTRADNCISFAQPGSPWNLEGYEQVPCFSSPSQPPSPMNLPSIPIVEGQNMGIKAIKNVVSQFTRFEGIVKRELPQRFGLDGFESWYLENGLTQMWSSFS